MIHRLQLAYIATLIVLGSAPLYGAAPGSVSGVVRDSAGLPQIGAEVQLLRADLSIICSTYTDLSGHYKIAPVLPGRYAVKALGAWFLPSLHENVRVRSNAVVNLTLSTLYEAMQWLPAEPRAGNAPKDDWKWTLRSAANRPLLRWLEDGPLVVVSDGDGAHPRLKARLMASGQKGVFGESGERISAAVEETPADSRELLASVDFSPGTDGSMESMLGFRQELGFAGSVQSVAAVALHPELEAGGGEGLDEAAVRGWEMIRLGDEFEAEAGSSQVLARSFGKSAGALTAVLPFASASWKRGNAAVRYRMTTQLPGPAEAEDTKAQAWLPRLSARNGAVAIERGQHQELGWERRTDRSGVAVLVYSDRIDNPVVEAMSHIARGDSEADSALADPDNGLLRIAGPEFTGTGVAASFERQLPGGNHLRLSYAEGNALALSAAQPASMAQAIAGVHPRHAQMYALSLSGTLDGTGTRWRASYRWQPEDTVTEVDPFAEEGSLPYLNLHLRQPIHLGSGSFETVLEVRNLLAQGYRPYLLSDGSLLVFAQDQRSISAGLAFSF
jgi:hypothetical protein